MCIVESFYPIWISRLTEPGTRVPSPHGSAAVPWNRPITTVSCHHPRPQGVCIAPDHNFVLYEPAESHPHRRKLASPIVPAPSLICGSRRLQRFDGGGSQLRCHDALRGYVHGHFTQPCKFKFETLARYTMQEAQPAWLCKIVTNQLGNPQSQRLCGKAHANTIVLQS